MIVKTRLREIPFKGIGLIADEPIKKNQVIYRDDINFDRVISGEVVETMPLLLKDFVKTNAAFKKEKNQYYLCCDNARFWNHSDTPNTKYLPADGIVIALVDILRDEELTSDYREFCDSCQDGDWGFEIR